MNQHNFSNRQRQGSNNQLMQPQAYQQSLQQFVEEYQLEISKSLYIFLAQNNGIGKEKPIKREGNLVVIGQQTSLQFENGISLALCIPNICQKLGMLLHPSSSRRRRCLYKSCDGRSQVDCLCDDVGTPVTAGANDIPFWFYPKVSTGCVA